MPLTDIKVKAAKPRAKPYKLADGAGMYVLVHPTGAKYWRLKYRFAGREKTLGLGVYPEVSIKTARERREAARAALRSGQDPSAKRKAEKRATEARAANSFETVARDFFEKHARRVTTKHAKHSLRRLEFDVFGPLGARPIADIEPLELRDVARKIEARGATDIAHRVVQICGQVFRYGIQSGLCTRNPAADLRGALVPHKKKHHPAVKRDELPQLLAKIAAYEGERQTVLALRLLVLVFLRTEELIGAGWREINLETGVWTVPAERMKVKRAAHFVPLSRQALEVLAELKAIAGESGFVFPGRILLKPISNNTMLNALYRLGYKSKQTVHGFRGVASTILNEAKRPDGSRMFDKDAIERQLAHCEENKVRAAYNSAEYISERTTMMQWWADYLDALPPSNP